jgi:diguanylate cyclase (GGDEF)-like protein/PAS domain S-box-containing protein
MRFVLIVIALAAIVWIAVLGDAERRADAHLANRLRIAQADVEVALERVRRTEEVTLSFLMDRPDLLTALATANGARTANQLDAVRKGLETYLTYRRGRTGEAILQSHALLDQDGRVLWRDSASPGPSVDMRDHSPLVVRALAEARPTQGMVPNVGYVVVSPLSDGTTVVGLLKAVVSFDRLIPALKANMPTVTSLRLHMGTKPNLDLRKLDNGGSDEDEAFASSVLAALDRDAWTQGFVSGKPFALFAEGRTGAALFLPLPDFQGRTMGYLVGSWPTEVHQAIRWGILPLLIGGSVLLLLFCLTALKLRTIWRRVERERSHLAAVTDTMAEGLCVMDASNRIAMVNAAAENLLGYKAEEMIGASAHDLFHVHSSDPNVGSPIGQCAIHRAISDRRKAHLETEFFRRRSGEIFPVEVFCSPVDEKALDRRRAELLRSRTVFHFVLEWLMGSVFLGYGERRWSEEVAVVTFTDLSERRHSEATLNKLSQAVEQSSASVVITDSDGVIEYVNPAFTRISGYDATDVIGQKPSLLRSGRVPKETYEDLWATITGGRAWKGEFHNRRKDGSLYWERATIAPIRAGEGEITHFVAVKDDITDWKNVEQELFHRANYDTLTGLPNRQFLMDRLTTALAVARREGHDVAVLFMDLDRFKQVNDSMGHTAGDVLLKQAASRMAAVLRPQDTLGRLGGDEFLVVSTGLKNKTEAAKVAVRLLDVVRKPFTIDKREVFVSGSIGIGVGPGGDTPGEDDKGPVTAQTLLRHADAAMYLAKEQGRDGYHFFTPDLEQSARRRLTIETGLRTATTDGSLRLAFQPVVETATGKVIKVEALLRWTHPQLGVVGPDEFIPLAEETGRIIELGRWVIEASCDAVLALDTPRDGSFRLAFNVSSKQFADDVLGTITQALESRNLDPRVLEVEITERLMLDPSSDAQDQLNALRAKGVRVAIDDFGTGYSALSYLTHFHIDTLKIDRGFVSVIVGDVRGQALIGAITGMAHGLDCKVVAEGVETPEQAGLLRDLGVDALQGYLLGRPMPLEDLIGCFGRAASWSIPLPTAHSVYDVLLGEPVQGDVEV